jgi:hypothetical protein
MSCWNPSAPNAVGSVARMICSLESAGSSTKSPSVASTIVANASSGARAVDGTWRRATCDMDGAGTPVAPRARRARARPGTTAGCVAPPPPSWRPRYAAHSRLRRGDQSVPPTPPRLRALLEGFPRPEADTCRASRSAAGRPSVPAWRTPPARSRRPPLCGTNTSSRYADELSLASDSGTIGRSGSSACATCWDGGASPNPATIRGAIRSASCLMSERERGS